MAVVWDLRVLALRGAFPDCAGYIGVPLNVSRVCPSWCGHPNLDHDSPLVRGYLGVDIRRRIGQKHDGARQEPFCMASRNLLISVSALSAVMKIGTFSIPVAM